MTGPHFKRLLHILQHCVGNTRRYPTLPPDEGRNYICAGPADLEACRELARMGLLPHGQEAGDCQYFYATPLGLEVGRMPPCHCDYLYLEE